MVTTQLAMVLFLTPYASLAKAVTTANGIASGANPIAILISPGIYIENNSAGPITVTADGISIVGDSHQLYYLFQAHQQTIFFQLTILCKLLI